MNPSLYKRTLLPPRGCCAGGSGQQPGSLVVAPAPGPLVQPAPDALRSGISPAGAAQLDADSVESAELACLEAYEAQLASQQACTPRAAALAPGALSANEATAPLELETQMPVAAVAQQGAAVPCHAAVQAPAPAVHAVHAELLAVPAQPPAAAQPEVVDLTADSPHFDQPPAQADYVDLLSAAASPTKRRHLAVQQVRRRCGVWHTWTAAIGRCQCSLGLRNAGRPGPQARQAKPRWPAAARGGWS